MRSATTAAPLIARRETTAAKFNNKLITEYDQKLKDLEKYLDDKKVLVVGTGISGVAATELLQKKGIAVTLFDGNKELDKANKKKSPAEVKTEAASDDITTKTPVYTIAKLSSNEDRFNELLKKYENEKDNLDTSEMKELLNELNSLIESQPKLSNFEIYNNFRADKLGLRVRKNKEVVKDDENIKDKQENLKNEKEKKGKGKVRREAGKVRNKNE